MGTQGQRAKRRKQGLGTWRLVRYADDFVVLVNGSRRHAEALRAETAAVLGERLGPALFQLPPDFARDVGLLREFIAMLGGRLRAAFEFRNRSWFDDDSALQALSDGGAALCIAESDRLASPVERTAPYIYVRLRKETYDDAALKEWAARLAHLGESAEETYVYFKHETGAPELAARLGRLLADGIR
jgi:uncharacterized protein YecE (DUF72 family)